MSSKWTGCRRWIFPSFDKCRIGTNDANFSSLDSARCENFMWLFPCLMWLSTIPKIDLTLIFSGTKFPFGITVRIDFWACRPLISFLILLCSVFIAWSSAFINSFRVTFL